MMRSKTFFVPPPQPSSTPKVMLWLRMKGADQLILERVSRVWQPLLPATYNWL